VFSGPEGHASGDTCEDGVLTLATLPFGPLPFGPLVSDLLDPPPEPPPITIENRL
jgi:hypothetical protein